MATALVFMVSVVIGKDAAKPPTADPIGNRSIMIKKNISISPVTVSDLVDLIHMVRDLVPKDPPIVQTEVKEVPVVPVLDLPESHPVYPIGSFGGDYRLRPGRRPIYPGIDRPIPIFPGNGRPRPIFPWLSLLRPIFGRFGVGRPRPRPFNPLGAMQFPGLFD